MLELGIDLNMPYYLERSIRAGTNVRATFKRMLEARMRRYMNAQRDRARQVTRFPTIAAQFYVEQDTQGDTMYWRFGNRNPAARYLEAREGVAPHTIVQDPHVIPFGKLVSWAEGLSNLTEIESPEALAAYTQALHTREEIVIEHPGIEPDEEVWAILREIEEDAAHIAAAALVDWGRRYGQEAA